MPRNPLGGRLNRGTRLARTGVRGAAGLAGARVRTMAGASDGADPHERIAEDLVAVLGDMKGAAMKLGQVLSFVDLDVPPDVRSTYHDALARLRDAAPAFDPGAIAQVLREELGAPAEAIFDHFDPTPLAAASIGQVHAATLPDGREVVVKVQYPGVAEAVRADLRNVESFAPLARLLSPNQEIRPLLEELRDRIDDELDYAREAQYQRAFAERYRNHPFVHVPAVVPELCRGRVLVSERIHGERFDDFVAHASEADRQRVGEIIFRYAFGSIGRYRLFNGDPHPGNYLVEPDCAADGGVRIAFVDYGSVKMFSRERHGAMRAIERALSTDDRDTDIEALRAAGFLPAGVQVDEDLVYDWFRLYTHPVLAEQPFTFTGEFAAEVIRSTMDPSSPYADVLRKLNLPPDYLLLNRIQWGLYSVLGRLESSGDWPAIRDEYLTEGAPPASPLGEQDAAWWQQRRAALPG